jgi:hypothetical protein
MIRTTPLTNGETRSPLFQGSFVGHGNGFVGLDRAISGALAADHALIL